MEYREPLGRDEQKPALPGVHLIAPTKFDRAVDGIKIVLRDWYSPLDIVNNFQLYGTLGIDHTVMRFLHRVILYARKNKLDITSANKSRIMKGLQSQYGYSDFKTITMMDAILEAKKAGFLSPEIIRPYDYQPTSVLQDVGQGASKAVKTNLLPIAVLGIGAIAAYGFATRGIPNVLTSRGT